MSCHRANPIFFNKKKINIGPPEHSLFPPPYIQQHLIFASPPIKKKKNGRHMCFSPYIFSLFDKMLA